MAVGSTNGQLNGKLVHQRKVSQLINVSPNSEMVVEITWDEPYANTNYLLSLSITGTGQNWAWTQWELISKLSTGCKVGFFNISSSLTSQGIVFTAEALGVLA